MPTKPQPDITVRDFEERDIEAVIALVRELQSHEIPFNRRLKPAEMLGMAYFEKSKEALSEHKGRFLVALSDDIIVGYATLYTEVIAAEEPEEYPSSYASVGDLIVTAKARGQGVAKLLLRVCEDHARKNGQKYLQLRVLAQNQIARQFYGSFGFEEYFVRMEKAL